MKPGDVVLARLQQSDGQFKTRPALVLAFMPPFDDLLISAISSKLRQEVRGFDEAIRESDSDFIQSGLKVESLVRLGMVATLPMAALLGKLGSISPERLARLQHRLGDHIKADRPD